MTWITIALALVALGVGVWLGLGAPGWPHKESLQGGRRRRLQHRSINPIAWTRSKQDHRSRRR